MSAVLVGQLVRRPFSLVRCRMQEGKWTDGLDGAPAAKRGDAGERVWAKPKWSGGQLAGYKLPLPRAG